MEGPGELGHFSNRGPRLFQLRESYGQRTAHAYRVEGGDTELLCDAGGGRAVGAHVPSGRQHAGHHPGGGDQRRALEEGVWIGPAHSGENGAPGQRCLSSGGSDAAWFSRPGTDQRGAEYGAVVPRRFYRCAVSTSAAQLAILDGLRAFETGTLDGGRTGAPRRAG